MLLYWAGISLKRAYENQNDMKDFFKKLYYQNVLVSSDSFKLPTVKLASSNT